MSVIKNMLLEEKERNMVMQNQYIKEISLLPIGSIVKKCRRSGEYYYLAYREKGKIVNVYLGKHGEKISKLRQDIAKRKHFKNLIKNLKSELTLIERVLR